MINFYLNLNRNKKKHFINRKKIFIYILKVSFFLIRRRNLNFQMEQID
jgi:hypothetical protein